MFNIIFVDDWIWTADFWNWKQPLYQLSHTTALEVYNFTMYVNYDSRLIWKQSNLLAHPWLGKRSILDQLIRSSLSL